jgi:hypothetical protein
MGRWLGRWSVWGFCLGLLGVAACSEATQTPSECTSDQYFDASQSLCRTCPILEVPSCPASCGVATRDDDQGCLEAVCLCERCEGESQDACLTCPQESYFDAQSLDCVPCPDLSGVSCAEGCTQRPASQDERGCAQLSCDCGR